MGHVIVKHNKEKKKKKNCFQNIWKPSHTHTKVPKHCQGLDPENNNKYMSIFSQQKLTVVWKKLTHIITLFKMFCKDLTNASDKVIRVSNMPNSGYDPADESK